MCRPRSRSATSQAMLRIAMASARGRLLSPSRENDSQGLNPTWQPAVTYTQYQYTEDENNNFWIQTNASGVSGSSRPAFEAQAIGASITDGGVSWLNVGPLRGFWTPGTQYAGLQQYVILDYNSNLQSAECRRSDQPDDSCLLAAERRHFPSELVDRRRWIHDRQWRRQCLRICLGPYNALGNTQLSPPNSPEQQAAVTVDLTLPKVVTRAIKSLVWHWYYNREPVTNGSVSRSSPAHRGHARLGHDSGLCPNPVIRFQRRTLTHENIFTAQRFSKGDRGCPARDDSEHCSLRQSYSAHDGRSDPEQRDGHGRSTDCYPGRMRHRQREHFHRDRARDPGFCRTRIRPRTTSRSRRSPILTAVRTHR